jgi:Dipeptidyl aminopeptidases/acylaminoacyl-peptidases
VILAAFAASITSPAAPSRHPITARDLVEVAEISPPTLSPDGKRVAYRVSRPSTERNAIMLEWHVSELDGTRVRVIGSGGDPRFEGSGSLAEQVPVWDADSRGLRYIARTDGAAAIWHWRENALPQREIVDEADILEFAVADDGKALRYTIGATRKAIADAERHAYENGVLVDERLDIMQPIAGGAIVDGKRVMQRLPTDWFERERLLWDDPRRQETRNLTDAPLASDPIFSVKVALQGSKVTDESGRTAEIQGKGEAQSVLISSRTGAIVPCRIALCRSSSLAALAWQPERDALLLFERAGRARERVWRWQTGAPRARLIATTDGGVRTSHRPPRCVVARSSLVCTESAPLAPPRLVAIDFSSGERHILADPNAELRARIRAKVIPIEGPDGSALLLRPAYASDRLPLVVQYYRCDGFLKGGVGDEIPMLPLVEHGIAVLCIEQARGTKGAADASYDRALDIIGGFLDDLDAAGVIDPARVGIGGLSFGSEVALWAIRKTNRFAASTISSGQISENYYWANALPGRGFTEMLQRYWQLGAPDEDRERWRALAPEAEVAAIRAPLLMQVPESEARYLIKFHTLLKRAGKPAELFAFADEPHVKMQPVHKLAIYARNLDWYRFWLQGEENSDPSKRGQYTRWRRLRAAQSLPVSARGSPVPEASPRCARGTGPPKRSAPSVQ